MQTSSLSVKSLISYFNHLENTESQERRVNLAVGARARNVQFNPTIILETKERDTTLPLNEPKIKNDDVLDVKESENLSVYESDKSVEECSEFKKCNDLLNIINTGNYTDSDLNNLNEVIELINNKLEEGLIKEQNLKEIGLLKSDNLDTLNADLKQNKCVCRCGTSRTAYIYPNGSIFKISSFEKVGIENNHLDLRLNKLLKEAEYNKKLDDFSYRLEILYVPSKNKIITMVVSFQDKSVRPLSREERIEEVKIESLYHKGYRFADLKTTNFAVLDSTEGKVIFPIDAKYIGLQRSNSIRSKNVKEHLEKINSPHSGSGLDSLKFYHAFRNSDTHYHSNSIDK